MINNKYPDASEQEEVKLLLKELLERNNNLLETLDIRMLDKDIVNLFGKSKLERIINNDIIQRGMLELSKEELQTYLYILNYNTTDFNERIANMNICVACKNINLDDLKKLNEKDRLKTISIILSDSKFSLYKLEEYYEKRRNICQEIIDNPNKIDEEYEKEINSEYENSIFPYELLWEMQSLNYLDRVKYAIIETKYGMSLEKANILCNAFGEDINGIKQSEETRIINELKNILKQTDISVLRNVNLEENYDNYVGTMNIFSNLKNSYLQKYKETLYQINEQDYIETQSVKLKDTQKIDIKIYNALGKNNDRSDFNMLLTSIGGIYCINHNYNDLKNDWDRADENHTISCSYIGSDFLGLVHDNYLLAFSDIQENELLQARNQDAGTVDNTFENWEDLNKNKFLLPQNQINSSKRYNELLVERKIEKDDKLINRKPTFAVFIAENIEDIHDKKNDRWKETKRMAAQLDIPIVIIDGEECTKIEFDKIKEMTRLVKEEKRMDLIPQIIHKIENNRGFNIREIKETRDQIFSNQSIKKCLEEIIGTIITSDIDICNQGIEEFVNVTKKVKSIYSEGDLDNVEEFKTYDYDAYINRLKILYSSRNSLNNIEEKNTTKQVTKNLGEIDFH